MGNPCHGRLGRCNWVRRVGSASGPGVNNYAYYLCLADNNAFLISVVVFPSPMKS